MNSREAILNRLRTALAANPSGIGTAATLPPAPEVWPQTGPGTDAMAEQFAREMAALRGEVHRCDSMDAARAKLAELIAELPSPTIGSVDRPICRELLSNMEAVEANWVDGQWQPDKIAKLSVGLVAAEWLLADTGSCVVASATPEQRLMCYLPSTCVVVARADQLAENLPTVWPQIAQQVADPERRGELVILTGPSRTADIEKILILGVHGPKRLVVLLVG